MHAIKFCFRTPYGPSGWLYVAADDTDPTAATLDPASAALGDLVAVLDRSHTFLSGIRAAGRDPRDIELGSVDLDPATLAEIPDTFAHIGLSSLS